MNTSHQDDMDSTAPPGTGARVALLIALMALVPLLLELGVAPPAPWLRQWYVPLHTFMECFAVVVAWLVFAVGWNGIDIHRRGMVLVAPAFLAVGLLDLGHLLSVKGMPGLGAPGSVGQGILFWLAARNLGGCALLALALVAAPAPASRAARRASLAGALAITALAGWIAVLHPDLLPATWTDGGGLTTFKVGAENMATLIVTAAALLLLRRARRTNSAGWWYATAAAAASAVQGVCFALYRESDDLMNFVGHVYKVMAYLCLYRAVFVTAVMRPYQRLARSERSLFESENKFRSLMEAAPDAIVLSDARGRIVMVNTCAEQLFGLPRHIAPGIPVQAFVPPGGQDLLEEVTCRRVQGEPFPAEVRRASLASGDARHDIAIVRDVSERRRLEKELLRQLSHDALTGLPNRARIIEMLDEAIGAARAAGRMLAVLVLDLDRFKKVNDDYGYSHGDAVLRECVQRIGGCLREGDTLARQGGNEFIVVQQGVSGRHEAGALAEALLARMREPFTPRSQQVFLSASVGIALMPEDEAGAAALLHKAQVAMGAARQDGPGRYRFHTWEMERAIRERVSMETFLRHALERQELALQYQPRVSMASNEIVGVEALVRWRHPALGLVAPGRFIPIAEETGMIEQIDMWVLNEACACAARWQAQGLPPVRVSVNLSARLFQQDGLARRVRAVLDETGLPPYRLELEITESTVMHDIRAAQTVLHSLKQLGVAVSIDDFGTGYSSLSYLKRFPIDVLKIDRSFVTDVMADPNDAAIVRALIALAHGLDLEAVAEGVETIDQLTFLKANGCDEIQGYYYSPPLWPEQLALMLAKKEHSSLH